MRTRLTKTMAQQLLRARKTAGMSQYELASELGWVRSKIKRLEKGEVESIDEKDLEQLLEALGVKDFPRKKEVAATNVLRLFPKQTGVVDGERYFTVIRRDLSRQMGPNCAFFRVTMGVTISPDALCGRSMTLMGLNGELNGVESASNQDLLRPGDELEVMLWGNGIAKIKNQGTSAQNE